MTINEKIGVCFKVHLILFCDSWLVYPSTSSQSVPYAVPHDCTQICEDCEPSVLGTARWQDKSQVWRRTEIGGFVLSNQVSRNLLISQVVCHLLIPYGISCLPSRLQAKLLCTSFSLPPWGGCRRVLTPRCSMLSHLLKEQGLGGFEPPIFCITFLTGSFNSVRGDPT